MQNGVSNMTMRLQSATRNSYNQWQIIELRIVIETRETSPNAAKWGL